MSRLPILRFAAGVVVVIPVVVALLIPKPVTFNIVAQTEELTVTFSRRGVIVWYLDGFDISYVDEHGEPATRGGFSGSFEPAPGARARITRRSMGPLELTIEVPPDSNKGAGIVRGEDEQEIKLPQQSSLTFVNAKVKANATNGNTIYLPIEGTPEFGSKVAVPSVPNAPILRTASVSLLARSPIARDVFNGGVYQLDSGDQFAVAGTAGIGQGFVSVNENPAFVTVFRVVGEQGRVTRFGGQGYDISVSVWQLLTNDPIVRNVWIVIGSVAAFIQLVWPAEKRRRADEDIT